MSVENGKKSIILNGEKTRFGLGNSFGKGNIGVILWQQSYTVPLMLFNNMLKEDEGK